MSKPIADYGYPERVKQVNGIEWVGITAGALTTIAYFPQVVATWRARTGRGLSYAMLIILNAGMAMWLAYGLLVDSVSIIWANAITLLFASTILTLKIRFDLRDRHLAQKLKAAGAAASRSRN